MGKYVTYIYQAPGHFPEMGPDDWGYSANGGRTPPPLMAKGREAFADFACVLGNLRIKRALFYGFHEASTVRRGFTKCNNRGRGARYWNSYRDIGGGTYFHEGG